MNTTDLIIYGLACYRLALLLSVDSGPYHLLSRFRGFLKREEKKHPQLKKSDLAHGVECIRCSSVSIAALIALFSCVRNSLPLLYRLAGDGVLLGLALSAAAILIHRIPK